MASSWLPQKDAELVPFAQHFSAETTATPAVYLMTPAEATTLDGLVTAFVTALGVATAPATRTPVTISQKEIAKAALLGALRSFTKRIQASTTVTPDQKAAIGVPVHKTTPTPIPAPVTRPIVAVLTPPVGRTVTISVKDETTPEKKAKPFGVDGAEVYSYVPTGDEAPPADLEKWRFEGIAKRYAFDVAFNPEDVGKTTYIVAVWFNPRGESGPVSTPATATVAA